jgi:P27 family predicted phage terminase small subunit
MQAPPHLSKKAKDLFDFYVKLTIETPGQLALFIRGLELMDQADEAAKIIRKEGLTVTSERSGLTRAHPLLSVQKETTAAMLKIWKILGLELNTKPTDFGFAKIVE